jgi:hypothetical protein
MEVLVFACCILYLAYLYGNAGPSLGFSIAIVARYTTFRLNPPETCSNVVALCYTRRMNTTTDKFTQPLQRARVSLRRKLVVQ